MLNPCDEICTLNVGNQSVATLNCMVSKSLTMGGVDEFMHNQHINAFIRLYDAKIMSLELLLKEKCGFDLSPLKRKKSCLTAECVGRCESYEDERLRNSLPPFATT